MIVGQDRLLRGMVIGLLADGHVLLEGVPGLAKTLAVQTLATCLGGDFKRIQFTPDLLPSDLLGTQVYNPKTGDWTVKLGPIFGNFVLADEINRAPAKVQSALLEAMQERQVTLSGESHALPKPFLVLATQNPIEQEGTYALPEAQVDRFMLKVKITYPTPEEEEQIVRRMARPSKTPVASRVAHPEQLLQARTLLEDVHVDDKLVRYLVALVFATRFPGGSRPCGHRAPHPVRGFTTCFDRHDTSRTCRGFPRGTRLRDTARRQDHRLGRVASSRDSELRSGGRGHHVRAAHPVGPRSRSRPVNAHDPHESLEDLLKEVRRIEVSSRRLVTDAMSGGYKSRLSWHWNRVRGSARVHRR